MTARIATSLRFVIVTQLLVACGPQRANDAQLPAGPVAAPPTTAAAAGETAVPPAVEQVPAAGSSAQQPMVEPPPASMGGGSPGVDPPVDAGTTVGGVKRALPVPEGTDCVVGCAAPFPVEARPLVEAATPPPPLGGGGMLVTRDGKQLIVADAVRDRLYFVDVEKHALAHERALTAGDQPGRMVEDAAGRIHVVLRGSGALLSVGRAPDAALSRRTLCALPRGLAYDAARDSLHVACAEGQLVTAPADASGAASRTVDLGRDLRDVIVRGDDLLVTRFRSAELLRVDASGKIKERLLPPIAQVTNLRDPMTGAMLPSTTSSPDLAWRAIDLGDKGSAVLHQRARDGQVKVQAGGYASMGCSGLIQTSVTIGLDGPRTVSADLSDSVVSTDMAADPSGTMLAVISPGNWGGSGQLRVYSLTGASALNPHAPVELQSSSPSGGAFAGPQFASGTSDLRCISPATHYPSPQGQLTAVSWVRGQYGLEIAAFEQEPAAISFIHVGTARGLSRIDLLQESRYDTGNALFHMRTFAGLACASCHGEVGDDGHVWIFEGLGERRTQSLRGGLIGTEPLHWGGEMKSFDTLVHDVFVARMQGPELTPEQSNLLLRYIDRQPLLVAPARDKAQAERGRALFQSAAVGCSGCHSGKLLTDNRSLDVGTGEVLQVPALRGVSFRLPLMHDGCATSLRQRFDAACGGGDKHGHTSQLAANELDDLIAYLETL